VRHWACTGRTGVSCICGVAMREKDTILIADRCLSGTTVADVPTYITYNDDNLPHDAGIKVSNSGRTFKVDDIIYSSSSLISMS